MSSNEAGVQSPRWAASSSEPLAVEKPNPFPYRTPTPNFGNAGPPSYAAIARNKARAHAPAKAAQHARRPPARNFSRYANENSFASAPAAQYVPRDRHSQF